MKQYITVKQLNELSEKGKERLKKWVISHSYNIGGFKHCEGQWIEVKGIKKGIEEFKWPFPLLSIGQMIEFLDEQNDGEYFDAMWANDKNNTRGHYRSFSWEYKEELCDCLWQAVKEIL